MRNDWDLLAWEAHGYEEAEQARELAAIAWDDDQEHDECSRCGRTAPLDSMERREIGRRDPETGYRDQVEVCQDCLDEEAEDGKWSKNDQGDQDLHDLMHEGDECPF